MEITIVFTKWYLLQHLYLKQWQNKLLKRLQAYSNYFILIRVMVDPDNAGHEVGIHPETDTSPS